MRFRICCLLIVYTIVVSANECFAGAALRVICEGEDVGAEVYINGKFKGECPIDMEVASGTLKLKVVKGENEFVQDIRIGDGVVKKVEAILTLNAAAQKRIREKNERYERELAIYNERIREKNERYERELAIYNERIKQIEAEESRANGKATADYMARREKCDSQYPQASTFIGSIWDANTGNITKKIKCWEDAQAAWDREKPTPIVRPSPPVKPK